MKTLDTVALSGVTQNVAESQVKVGAGAKFMDKTKAVKNWIKDKTIQVLPYIFAITSVTSLGVGAYAADKSPHQGSHYKVVQAWRASERYKVGTAAWITFAAATVAAGLAASEKYHYNNEKARAQEEAAKAALEANRQTRS